MGSLPDEIATERLRVRLWRPDDVPAVRTAIEESLDHLRPWLAWVPFEPVSDEDRTRFIIASNDDWVHGGDASYGVFRDGIVIGGCGLHHRWGPTTLDLGYWIHVDHIGRGYAQELARGLTDASFMVEGIDRVEIHHDKANERSRAVPLGLGFDRGPERPDDVGAPAEVGIDCTWSISRSAWTARQRGPRVTD
jgi:RimJ/RimL family protein N-acetyltransferase